MVDGTPVGMAFCFQPRQSKIVAGWTAITNVNQTISALPVGVKPYPQCNTPRHRELIANGLPIDALATCSIALAVGTMVPTTVAKCGYFAKAGCAGLSWSVTQRHGSPYLRSSSPSRSPSAMLAARGRGVHRKHRKRPEIQGPVDARCSTSYIRDR